MPSYYKYLPHFPQSQTSGALVKPNNGYYPLTMYVHYIPSHALVVYSPCFIVLLLLLLFFFALSSFTFCDSLLSTHYYYRLMDINSCKEEICDIWISYFSTHICLPTREVVVWPGVVSMREPPTDDKIFINCLSMPDYLPWVPYLYLDVWPLAMSRRYL